MTLLVEVEGRPLARQGDLVIGWQTLATGGSHMAEEEFLTIPEVAALLRIGQRTTYDLARRGQLGGAIKVGNQWRVSRRALEQWVRHGTSTSEARGTRDTRGAKKSER